MDFNYRIWDARHTGKTGNIIATPSYAKTTTIASLIITYQATKSTNLGIIGISIAPAEVADALIAVITDATNVLKYGAAAQPITRAAAVKCDTLNSIVKAYVITGSTKVTAHPQFIYVFLQVIPAPIKKLTF